jgi:hypothetical protein
MYIEFPIYRLKKDSSTYKRWSEVEYLKNVVDEDFIAVGEENNNIKLISVDDNGICLIGGLMLDEAAYLVPEMDIEKTCYIEEYNIPKKYLSMDTIENIQKVNEKLSL